MSVGIHKIGLYSICIQRTDFEIMIVPI